MDVVVSDVAGEPVHDPTHVHVAGGVQCREGVVPIAPRLDLGARKIVLGVENVAADGVSDHQWQNECPHERFGGKDGQSGDECRVEGERDSGIEVFLRVIEEWLEAHAVSKDREVAHKDR